MARGTRGAVAVALIIASASSVAQDAAVKPFTPEQIKQGAKLYAARCESCHGVRMVGGQWAIDLKAFPRDKPARFVDSVTYGIKNMPPWGDVLTPQDIQALWAYVIAGESR